MSRKEEVIEWFKKQSTAVIATIVILAVALFIFTS